MNIDSLSGRRALITGGLGFIGSNLAHYLVERDAQVTIIDSLDPRSGGQLANLNGIEDQVELIITDIRSFDSVAMATYRADLIFHCAAHTSHPYSMRDPQRDIEVNCIGTINILEALRRFRPSARMVYVGTSTQIGEMVQQPINEEHPVSPVDIYSANKAAAEYYCRIYARAYDLSINTVRLPNIYGPRAIIANPDLGFINYFIGRALNGQDLTIFGAGEQLRSVLYVDDALRALVLAADFERGGELWFATTNDSVSVKQIAESTVSACGSGQIVYVDWPQARQLIDVGSIVIDSTRIRRDLKWSATTDLQTGLRTTVAYFQALS